MLTPTQPAGALQKILEVREGDRGAAVGRDDHGTLWVYDPRTSRIAGRFSGASRVLPAPGSVDFYVIAGRTDARDTTTTIEVDAAGDRQLCRVHEHVWLSAPRPFRDGLMLRIISTDATGETTVAELPPLERRMLTIGPSTYAPL